MAVEAKELLLDIAAQSLARKRENPQLRTNQNVPAGFFEMLELGFSLSERFGVDAFELRPTKGGVEMSMIRFDEVREVEEDKGDLELAVEVIRQDHITLGQTITRFEEAIQKGQVVDLDEYRRVKENWEIHTEVFRFVEAIDQYQQSIGLGKLFPDQEVNEVAKPADNSITVLGRAITDLVQVEHKICSLLVDPQGQRTDAASLAWEIYGEEIRSGVLDQRTAEHYIRTKISHIRAVKLPTDLDIINPRIVKGTPRSQGGEYKFIEVKRDRGRGARKFKSTTMPKVGIYFETGDTWVNEAYLKGFKEHHRRIMRELAAHAQQYVIESRLKEILDEAQFYRNESPVGYAIDKMRVMIRKLRMAEIDPNFLIECQRMGREKKYRLNAYVVNVMDLPEGLNGSSN
jgi:hypothetical protein